MSDITPFHWHGTWDEFNEQVRQAWDGREGQPLTAHVGHAARPESPPSPPPCGCPEQGGITYHQQGSCTDPVVATPGQAAREAFGELGADWYPGTPWNGLHEDLRAQWDAAAQAAVARYVELNGRDPVDARAVIAEVLGEQAAPELAAAMAETRAVRDGYQALCGEFGPSAQSGWSARISLTVLNRHLRAAGLAELPRTAASGDREDVTMRYRRERDEARDEANRLRPEVARLYVERDEAREQAEQMEVERNDARQLLRRQQQVDAAAYRTEVDRITAEAGALATSHGKLHELAAEILREVAGWTIVGEDLARIAEWRKRAGLDGDGG